MRLLFCRYTMVSMNVPEPVMSLAVMPKARDATGNFSKALNRWAFYLQDGANVMPLNQKGHRHYCCYLRGRKAAPA